jgi:hypothetical protein
LAGTRPHTIAAAVEGSSEVRLMNGPNGLDSFDVGIYPTAVANGDVDGDGTDELVALSSDGYLSICKLTTSHCELAGIDTATASEVAVGDIDGDGFAEPIFLIDHGDSSELIAYNADAAITGQEETVSWPLDVKVRGMAAGDVDGDGVAEIMLLEDGGWWGWFNDKLHVFSAGAGAIVTSSDVDGHSRDIAVGDRDADERAEIAVLRDAPKLQLFQVADQGQLGSVGEWDVAVGNEPQRLAMVDWDGDSARGELLEGPELIAGDAVPIAALMFPPFPDKVAKSVLSAKVSLGSSETTTESESESVALSLGMGVSYGADIWVLKASVSASLKKSFKVSHKTSKSITVGARYGARADTELFGTDYAAVVMSCGCYHRYRYQTDDPSGAVGGSGTTFDIFVPVGGQAQIWSSHRYNLLAEAVGTLPAIKIPVRVGDVDSYPRAPQTLDGSPIPAEDLLFPEPPSYTASDVSHVTFQLSSKETETNSVAETTSVGVGASFGAFGAGVDVNASLGVTQGYSVSAGKAISFGGSIPPIPDDPDTPEDEYQVHRYTMTPWVYREHYTNRHGEDAGYYVLTYSANQ